jgi:uncharacterized membrane protein (UPF0182 family)
MFTRVPSDYTAGRRRPWTVVVVIIVGIYLLLTAAGTLWTDLLWFESVGFGDVWLRNWGLSILLGAIGIGFSFLIIWVALRLIDRFSPRWAPFDLTEEEELLERFREWVEPRIRQIRIILTGGLALIMGLTVAAWRDDVFLFINSQDFGQTDAIFNDIDIGFYVFRLPLWQNAFDWLFNLLVLVTVVVAIGLYLNGAIRISGRRVSATRGAKIYVSVLFAILSLVRAVSYRFDMYELLYSDSNGIFFGPGYTDFNARLPVLRLLIVVALIAAALFVVNIFRRGWTLAAVSVGSWIVVAIAAGAIYPAFIQRFSVLPNQLNRETEFITHNMAATKEAWMLDEIEVRDFRASDELSAADIEANGNTIDNLRIWNTSVLPRTYQNFQELEPYYQLSMVDTDRYLADGSPNQVMIAVRELDEPEVPPDWQNQNLFYTHGYGAVVNQANVVQADGQPVFLLRDVPPTASVESLELDDPQIYFGETYEPRRPVIVRTGSNPQEIDIPLPTGTGFNEYEGEAGVVLDNFFKRIAFAFRYRDLNLLISNQIRSDSRVLVERNVTAIVEQLAPFLSADADPYPIILDGEVLWVLDMYTTTSFYPYSQPVDFDARDRLKLTSDVDLGVNYVRNSVKAIIDSSNGDVTFYVFDPSDPIVNAWAETHPDLFAPASEMPEGIENHLRYPQDLFRVQSQIYIDYHVTEENQLFSGNDEWSFPGDPSGNLREENDRLWGDVTSTDGTQLSQIMPYYLLTELPGEEQVSYLLLQPFNPRARRNMVAFLVADSTAGNYGRLIDFRMPQGELVDGAQQAGQRIEQDAEISQQLSLWRGEGSDVIKGDLLIVPIEESVVYFQPIFLEEDGGAFPEFRRVAVVYSDRVEWADSLDGALELVFGAPGEDDEGDDEETPTEPPVEGSIEELIQEAEDAFANADAALRQGNLAEYQNFIDEAQRVLNEIADLVGSSEPDASAANPM